MLTFSALETRDLTLVQRKENTDMIKKNDRCRRPHQTDEWRKKNVHLIN